MPGQQAIVMGGSLAGLSAAVFLERAGWKVDVFERSRRPLEGRGAGIVLHPAVFRVLGGDSAGISAEALSLRYLDREGTLASEQPCHYRFISYAALHRALLERLERSGYHLGSKIDDFADSGDAVEVTLAGGGRATGDLLIAADGIHSTARRRLLPQVESRYAGYVGWRGTVAEGELSDGAHRAFAEAITYCVVPNSHILVYPIPSLDGSLDPRRRLINWVWYRNVERTELDRVLTDRTGVRRSVSVGAGDVAAAVVDELRREAAATLPPQLVELVGRSATPFVQAVFDIEVPHMAFGRTALIGDAAFAVRPHLAVGTAKAADDAWSLCRALEEQPGDVPGALRSWEAGRLALGRSAVLRARDAGMRSQFHNSWRVGDPLPFGLHEAGDSLLEPQLASTSTRRAT